MPTDACPLARADLDSSIPILPALTDLQQPFRIVGDHAVKTLPDAPLHHVHIVDRPGIERAVLGSAFADEAGSDAGADERALQHVEGDVGDGEELAGVRDGEADVGDGEGWKVGAAEGEVFGCPAPEDDTLVPGPVGCGPDGGYGGGDETHDGVGIVVGLDVEQEPDVLLAGFGKVLEQVSKTGHVLVGGLDCLLLPDMVPRVVDDLLISAKATLKGRILERRLELIFWGQVLGYSHGRERPHCLW